MSEVPLLEFASQEPNSFVDGPFGSDLKVSDYAESGVRILQLQNLGDGYFIDDNLKFASQEKALSLARCLVRPGDLLIAKMAHPLARACIVPPEIDRGLIVADLIKLRLDRAHDTTYVCSAINDHHFRREAERLSTGTTRTRISLSTLKRIKLRSRPSKEQQWIGNLVRTIDEAIERTEALIAKYQQLKSGLMHDLFTRGVTLGGHLRPPQSEVPHLYKQSSLGWIPNEWEAPLLDDIALRGSGHTPNRNFPEFWNGGIKWVSLADSWRLDRLYISDTDKEISEQGIANSSAVLHPPGIVVLSRDAGVGKSAITTCSMAVSQHFMCWRCGPKLDKHYLYFWLQYRKREFENIATGSTIPTIGLRFFKHYRIKASVALEEQKQIGEMLRSLETNIFSEEDHLAKLRQQKQGLMHDLLTGRVPVTL